MPDLANTIVFHVSPELEWFATRTARAINERTPKIGENHVNIPRSVVAFEVLVNPCFADPDVFLVKSGLDEPFDHQMRYPSPAFKPEVFHSGRWMSLQEYRDLGLRDVNQPKGHVPRLLCIAPEG